ncbi:hypothetical protein GCM10010921_00410 [Microbacterium album]|uniref:Uncharacterized protein n=1 Tax=Microbacterium album TaxID=2053191 RepID=A0A917ICP9_9MICO|nr:hypothetical protein GCM10010921_00410 [Microbacterium album]
MHRRDRGIDGSRVGDVADDIDHTGARLRRALDVEAGHHEPVGAETFGDRRPDPARAAREQDDPLGVLPVVRHRSERSAAGQMPWRPGLRMPRGSTASLIFSTKRR